MALIPVFLLLQGAQDIKIIGVHGQAGEGGPGQRPGQSQRRRSSVDEQHVVVSDVLNRAGGDADGNACHIYVENNGWFDDLTKTMPFHTVPTFYTDSKALAPYLHCNRFVGEGVDEADGLHIYFYEIGGQTDA